MCGIAGYLLYNDTASPTAGLIRALMAAIDHRGPDDEGGCLIHRRNGVCRTYKTDGTAPSAGYGLTHILDDEASIPHDLCLLHTRYSIIDLSEGAHQPFLSGDKSVVCVFNGEIYNYIELRDELTGLGVRFKTASDTEVLVEGYRFWGNSLWNRLNGFWAVALYDFTNGDLVFSRDRIGVAPLYYRELPEGFFFASTIYALIDICPEGIDRDDDVIRGFIETGIKDHDQTTFYAGIRSMPSATTVTFRPGVFTFDKAAKGKYWDFPESRLSIGELSFEEAKIRFRDTFFSAVELRLRSDVPLAFELSGGLDSSSVVAAAAVLGSGDITTYTAKIAGADEEPYARSMLQRYSLDYRVIEKVEDDFVSDCASFSEIMEEPYDNPNGYTHYRMLQRMKEQGVCVVVTGAGGDEILAGYEHAFWPSAYRELKENGFFRHADWYEFCRRFKTVDQSWKTLRHYVEDLPGFLKRRFVPGSGKPAGRAKSTASRYQTGYGSLSFHQQCLYHFKVALVPYYMRSSDHFTMAVPIEHRFPLLDYRLVDLCLRLPIPYLFRGGWTKYLLRKAMEPYLPKKIAWRRKKMGFAFPFRPYFSDNRALFFPLLSHLKPLDFLSDHYPDYDFLLQNDPVLLWRLLSTAIWLQNQRNNRIGA